MGTWLRMLQGARPTNARFSVTGSDFAIDALTLGTHLRVAYQVGCLVISSKVLILQDVIEIVPISNFGLPAAGKLYV